MKWIVMGMILVVYAFEMVVALLNHRSRMKFIPDRLKDIYDEERYYQWLAYSLDIHRFTMIRRGVNVLILLAFLFFGLFERIEATTSTWTTSPIMQSLYFLGFYQTFIVLLGIPFKHYQTFHIEARHGFNRTTKKTFTRDIIMGYIMTIVLGGLILGGLHALYLVFQDHLWTFILVSWASISVVMFLIFAFLNKVFLRLFNKFTPLPEGTLRTRIEQLASSLGFNIKALYVMDASKRSTKLNAFFTGIGKAKEVVLFDTLIEKMSEDEILAVLAHELGHAVHKDTWRMLFQQFAVVILYAAGIGLILQTPTLFTSFGLSGIHFGFAIILFMILFEPIEIFLGIPLNALSRRAEYKADRFSAKQTDAQHMISALKVLSREDLVNLTPHPLFVLLYYSHPPMNERIEALE